MKAGTKCPVEKMLGSRPQEALKQAMRPPPVFCGPVDEWQSHLTRKSEDAGSNPAGAYNANLSDQFTTKGGTVNGRLRNSFKIKN